jgi:hypothetical protein
MPLLAEVSSPKAEAALWIFTFCDGFVKVLSDNCFKNVELRPSTISTMCATHVKHEHCGQTPRTHGHSPRKYCEIKRKSVERGWFTNEDVNGLVLDQKTDPGRLHARPWDNSTWFEHTSGCHQHEGVVRALIAIVMDVRASGKQASLSTLS